MGIEVDMWSLGVIMYVLLCGYPPFYGETDAEVLTKVRLGNFSLNAEDWKDKSEYCKNLVRMCLKMNPKDRPTPEQALNHEWFKNTADASAAAPTDSNFLEKFKAFRNASKFKKVALQALALKLQDSEIK